MRVSRLLLGGRRRLSYAQLRTFEVEPILEQSTTSMALIAP
jgi:hypothetical protein